MDRPVPVSTVELFPLLDEKLMELLRSMPLSGWEKQTTASQWKVKDIAAHLLDGNIRGISLLRDRHYGENPGTLDSYADLVAYLNRLNADWVRAMKRVSPALLTGLLETTGQEYIKVLRSLDPFGKAVFPVAWAGEEESANWFHIAREYTEKWHHQQQIRLAAGGEEELLTERLYLPFLNTCMYAMPHHYRAVIRPDGYSIQVFISEKAGFRWFLVRKEGRWQLTKAWKGPFHCTIHIDPKRAWRIFTKSISREEAEAATRTEGDHETGKIMLNMLSVMA